MINPEYGKPVVVMSENGKEETAYLSNEDGHEIWISTETERYINEPKSWKEPRIEET